MPHLGLLGPYVSYQASMDLPTIMKGGTEVTVAQEAQIRAILEQDFRLHRQLQIIRLPHDPNAPEPVPPTTPPTTDVALLGHINDTTPHPAYDDIPSLVLLFENGLI